MEFCPDCGTRLVMKQKEEENGFFECPKCGYKKSGKLKPHVMNASEDKDQIIIIGKKEQKLKTIPTVNIECPKCNNNLVYAWQVQTRGADESSTQFFRCTKCKYTFREYS
jgi:DNA-directed RNA polymerase subunit M